MTVHAAAAILAMLAATALGCAACAIPVNPAAPPARPDAASHRPLAEAACPAVPLPVSPAGLSAADALAARFAADYLTRPPGQPPAAASLAAVRIRDLAAGSVILTITARVRQAADAATTTTLAVTIVQGAAGWAVYDVEPANSGNAG